jgi:prepilin signal peptidase PulO-like enzyme (type II secretory pathway)
VVQIGTFEIIFVAILGLILGSFCTAITHRESEGQSWFSCGEQKRSACPSCGIKLQISDLIPVFSWLFLKGRCRHCQKPIPRIYPALELTVMILCLIYVLLRGLSPLAISLPSLFAVPFLVALCVVDLRQKILPNTLLLALVLLGGVRLVAFGFAGMDWGVLLTEYGAGALIFGALSFALSKMMTIALKKEAMGMGDVKFFLVAGLWLGLSSLANFMTLGGVLGVTLGIVWLKVRKESTFPFGPALIASFYVLLLI